MTAAPVAASRFEQAVATLRTGGAVLLADEARPGRAHTVALDGPAPAATLRILGRFGGSPVPAAARKGGVLAHPDPAEAAVDLAAAAGGSPAVFAAAEVPGGLLAPDGEAARLARRMNLPLVTIQDVVDHRLRTEPVVVEVAAADLPSVHASAVLRVHAFRSLADGVEHLALVHRPAGGFGAAPLVRLHSECLTGDALGSLRCDCGEQLRDALRRVAEDPQGGAVLYLRGQEGRGIGLANKIRAYALQDGGLDTVDANTQLGFAADARDYGTAVAMLRVLGIPRLRLLSNNPMKSAALERYGVIVQERRALRIGANPHNASYLATKRVRMGHDLPDDESTGTASDSR